jgi:predicted dehydrogenase
VTLGVAVIGCGLTGTKRALALPPGSRLVSVFDVEHGRAKSLADRVGGEVRVARSAAEALGTDGVDLAIIATVHRDLAPLAGEATEAGRHVLIEKPGACRPCELHQVRRSAADRKLLVRVGFNHRFHPALLRARELVQGGAYGSLLYIRARYGHGGRLGYEGEWRAEPTISGGGELLDQGIHLIDLTRYLGGEVELAFAELTSAFWPMPVEDNAFLCLRLPAGGVAWLHASWTEWKNLFSFEITHRTAKIEVQGLGGSYGVERLTLYEMRPEMGPPDTSAWEWPRGDDSWAAELADVVTAIGGQPGQGATIDDAIAALEIVEEVYGR